MVNPFIAPLIAIACMLAVIAHELTHYLAARIANRNPHIDWIDVYTYWELNDTKTPTTTDTLIYYAPVLAGFTWGGLYMAFIGLQLPYFAVAAPTWIFYTLNASELFNPGHTEYTASQRTEHQS